MPPKTLALWLAAILATYCHAIDIINGTEHSNGDIATGTTASASHNVKRTDLELNTEKGDPLCPLFTTLGSNQNENDLGRTLNIHMVPHTHDDVGWLKTVDQYYYGLNNTIQDANVSLILDSVLDQLLDNTTHHHRTFTYVETAFFSKWYLSLPPTQQQSVKNLIANQQLSFANGGWCMHDEATTHYMGMIDQTTLGHSFLKQELGVVPKVGWQLDPFGHSATQGGLMTRGVGFDALYFGRIHYVDLKNRQEEAQCEGIWSSSSSPSEEEGSIFWGLSGSYRGNYGAPDGFCFDESCNDKPLVGLSEFDLQDRVKKFLTSVGVQANQTKGRNLMLTMGSDFQFSHARKNYENMDLLIDATREFLANGTIQVSDIFGNRFDTVKIFYSTPERYTQCKHVDLTNAKQDEMAEKSNSPTTHHSNHNDQETSSTSLHRQPSRAELSFEKQSDKINVRTVEPKFNPLNWSVKKGDFFPYADCDHCYWTGYFTSRQGLKRLERVGSSFLHTSRQIESMLKLQQSDRGSRGRNSEGMIAANKEGNGVPSWPLSGPSVKSWNSSPLYTLEEAMGVAQHHDAVAGTSKQHVAYDYAKQIASGMSDASVFVTSGLRDLLLDPSALSTGALENLSYCHLHNETICDVSQYASLDDDQTIYVVVYNALGIIRSEVISIPVEIDAHYSVERLRSTPDDWLSVDSSLIPNANYAKVSGAALYALHFDAGGLPPLGSSVFRITQSVANMDSFSAVIRSARETPISNPPSFPNSSKPPNYLRSSNEKRSKFVKENDDDLVISNGILSVAFNRSNGVIKSISESQDGGVSLEIQQDYGFYTAFGPEYPATNLQDSKEDGVCLHEMPWLLGSGSELQHSGAYIFRPKTPDESLQIIQPNASSGSVLIYESDLVTEVHAEFGEPSWIKQITRIISGKNYVEVEYVVGPVPINDLVGKDVVSRYSTSSIVNGGKFFSDSNGREFMMRKRGDHNVFGFDGDVDIEPVASNFYPVNAAIFVEDESHSLSVLVDRSQGGSSLSDGSVELMIQRRGLYDDARGVGEPLDETDGGITPCRPYGFSTRLGKGVVVKGTHRLMIGKGKSGASQSRTQMDQVFSQPHVFVGSAGKGEHIPFNQANLSVLKSALPNNVMVITLAALDEDNSFLIRLGHQFDKGESEHLSSPVQVDLSDLFPGRNIVSTTEKTLSGNQNVVDWEQTRLDWSATAQKDLVGNAESVQDGSNVITLKPLEIRTFVINVL